MAVRSREELIAKITEKIGADTSDEAITLIEDVTDTLSDLETKASSDGKDWKAEAERIDKEWREKYVKRFSSSSSNEDDNDDNKDVVKNYTYENLFKEKE